MTVGDYYEVDPKHGKENENNEDRKKSRVYCDILREDEMNIFTRI